MILHGRTITVKISKRTITITNSEDIDDLESVQEVLTGAGMIVFDKRRGNNATWDELSSTNAKRKRK